MVSIAFLGESTKTDGYIWNDVFVERVNARHGYVVCATCVVTWGEHSTLRFALRAQLRG